MVTAILVTFAVLVTLGAVSTVARVGKPAKPITNGIAVWSVLIAIVELAALLYLSSKV